MSDLFLLSKAQMARISPHFPLSHGVPRVDDRRVVSGIIYVIRNGLQWRDAPKALWPAQDALQPLHPLEPARGLRPDLRQRWPAKGQARAHHDRCHPPEGPPHRGEPAQKGAVPRRIGRTKGGLNSKLHAVCDGDGKPLVLLLTEGQMSDHTGARLLLPDLPDADTLIADKGYDSDWFREALTAWSIDALHSAEANRKAQHPYDKQTSTSSATGSSTCSAGSRTGAASPPATTAAPTPSSRAICIAATVIFYLDQ